MKKILSLFLAIFAVVGALAACDSVVPPLGGSTESSSSGDPICDMDLTHIMQKLPFEYNVNGLCEKYNAFWGGGYLVIDNAAAYCEFLDDVGVPYEGPFDALFEENVMLCYLRTVSGSAVFMSVEYYYDSDANAIKCETVYKQPDDTEYPDVVICECVDIVKVPKAIFDKIRDRET